MHHGKGVGAAPGAPRSMPHVDRLALAFAVAARSRCPRRGDDPRPPRRARPPSSIWCPRGRLRCEQSFRPLHDALAERGHAVAARAEGPAAMVVVNLTRSRAENLGNVARGLDAAAARRHAGRRRRQDRRRRQPRPPGRPGRCRSTAPSSRRTGGSFWLDPPGHAARRRSPAWARDAAPAPQRRGLPHRARACSRPSTPTPAAAGSPRRSPGGSRGRVADLGAGWGWLAQAALARLPRHHRARPLRGRGAGARRRPRQRPRPARPLPLGRRRPARAAACRPTTR